VNRRWATRLAAPAAFLAGVTVAVLLVRAGLDDEPTTTAAQTSVATTARPTTTATRTQPRPAVYVRVEAGDTLDQIALDNDTSVERLLTLNPGLDPTALQVGQRIRVR
jgi:LysM repeat protein